MLNARGCVASKYGRARSIAKIARRLAENSRRRAQRIYCQRVLWWSVAGSRHAIGELFQIWFEYHDTAHSISKFTVINGCPDMALVIYMSRDCNRKMNITIFV